MNKKENNIVYVFVDTQNLNKSFKKLGFDLDYKKLYLFLTEQFNTKKIYLFLGYIKQYQNFYNKLFSFGYKLIFKPIVMQKKIIKGNCDADLVLHAMLQYKNYDKVVIVTGDGDFHCLIEYLAQHNKLEAIAIPNIKSCSSLLKKFKKYFFLLENYKNEFVKNNIEIVIHKLINSEVCKK